MLTEPFSRPGLLLHHVFQGPAGSVTLCSRSAVGLSDRGGGLVPAGGGRVLPLGLALQTGPPGKELVCSSGPGKGEKHRTGGLAESAGGHISSHPCSRQGQPSLSHPQVKQCSAKEIPARSQIPAPRSSHIQGPCCAMGPYLQASPIATPCLNGRPGIPALPHKLYRALAPSPVLRLVALQRVEWGSSCVTLAACCPGHAARAAPASTGCSFWQAVIRRVIACMCVPLQREAAGLARAQAASGASDSLSPLLTPWFALEFAPRSGY